MSKAANQRRLASLTGRPKAAARHFRLQAATLHPTIVAAAGDSF
jgi:hypothetical protein